MEKNNIFDEFYIFYQEVTKYYAEKNEKQNNWNKISEITCANRQIINNIYLHLKKQQIRKDIILDYSRNSEYNIKQIKVENNNIVKISLIIVELHHIFYDLLSLKGNYLFALDGPKEMHVLKKKIKYYVNMSKKNDQNIYFHAFILLYALESLFNHHFYLCIDFEFSTKSIRSGQLNKNIRLAQLNFEHNVALQSIIMIVSPIELDEDVIDDLINLILCNKFIRKILHGSDSLDIPYVYKELLQNDPNKIINFTKNLIDTRFICEYYKLSRDISSDNKCSIYDEDPSRSAVFNFGLISEEQQSNLSKIFDSMGPVADISWNIHKMPESQILYAQYDVLFLKYFYYRVIYVATKDEESELGKMAIITLYKHVINEFVRFTYLERNEVTFLMHKCKEECDPINNYYIKNANGIFKMVDIFNSVIPDLETVNPKTNIDKLMKVNHFRAPIRIIIKRIVYGHISQKCKVRKNKNSYWEESLFNTFIFDFFGKIKYYYLQKIFEELNKILESRVKHICS